MEFSVSVVFSGLEEIKEDLVGIGCADQLAYGKSHVLGIECCEDISEVAGGNTDVDLLSRGDPLLLKEPGVCIDVVADLGNKSSDVDGIGRRENKSLLVKLSCKLLIAEDLLYSGLGIVKVSVDADYESICSALS